jgi:phospho-N-acetylmuramoyl-pentapeptide-transferase
VFAYLYMLQDMFSPLRVFRYITLRAVAGAGTAFLLSVVFGPWVIRRLRAMQIRQYERREEAPPLYVLHGKKEGTPTMGGFLIIGTVCVSTLLWAVPTNPFVWIALGTMAAMGLVGFWDDYLKTTRKRSKGLRARGKLLLQLAWAVAVMALLAAMPETRERVRQLMVPFLKDPVIRDMGIAAAFLFLALVLIGATNAVNLTDGLDGLAIGCTGSVAVCYLALSYVAGHSAFAQYLRIPYVRGAGELAVFCGCLLGSSLGFLWFNCHPAQVFMGDTGSLALGGALAAVAILIKQELLLVLVGGVFVMEALSVIIQVAYFKWRGKRIFAMAPIHHHFEMKQWSETQVTIRFWILSIILALLGMMTLKIR